MSTKPKRDLSLDDLLSSNQRRDDAGGGPAPIRRKDDPFSGSGGRMRLDDIEGLPDAVDPAQEGVIGGGPKRRRARDVGRSGLDGLSPKKN
ncbi:MAG: hypothetical protein ACOZNI_08150 [Myxococcota bacterium]